MKTYNQEYGAMFWSNIDALRKKKGISWRCLAKKLSISVENLCHSRASGTLPKLSKLSAFADALDCSLEDLVDL